MDAAELRAQFPVLAGGTAFLNAGTCGPLAETAVAAALRATEMAGSQGRYGSWLERLIAAREELRGAYAALLGAEARDVAVTTSTSEGMGRVIAGLDLGPGDEILTATLEHPGVLGPLYSARAERGVSVREVELSSICDAVGPATRLVACSHVHWMSGAVAPAELGDLGDDVLVLLDGAQSAGALPVDVGALGCDFYAAAGQKWLCGPVGLGMLWLSPAAFDRVRAPVPAYLNIADTSDTLGGGLHGDARRHDAGSLDLAPLECALAGLEILGRFGWDALFERAAGLARSLADELSARGVAVVGRGDTTLVAWESPGEDPEAARDRLAASGIVIRNLPGTQRLRASVGAWNDESDLERLLEAL